MTNLSNLFKSPYIKILNNRFVVFNENGEKIDNCKNLTQANEKLKEVLLLNEKKENNINKLRKVAKTLRDIGEHNLCNKILIVLAQETGLENTQADLSYSFVMRKLRKGDKDRLKTFMQVFKNTFDEAYDDDIENPEEPALLAALKAIDYKDGEFNDS